MSDVEKSYLQPSTSYENSSEAIYEMGRSLIEVLFIQSIARRESRGEV